MGILYRAFQHLAYESMQEARKKGLEVDKERERLKQEKHKQEFYDAVGINWGHLNKVWNDAMGEDD